MSEREAPRRGELWTVAGGPACAGKPRPALVVQSDIYARLGSVTICGLTAFPADAPVTRPLVERSPMNGLETPSRVMVDKITTVRRTSFGHRIGTLDDSDLERVDRALLVYLGLSR